MSVKRAVVLLALVAASQAYVIIDTWADENCNTSLVAKFIVSQNNILHLLILQIPSDPNPNFFSQDKR